MTYLQCGGKRSATPLWIAVQIENPQRRRRFALPAHSRVIYSAISRFDISMK